MVGDTKNKLFHHPRLLTALTCAQFLASIATPSLGLINQSTNAESEALEPLFDIDIPVLINGSRRGEVAARVGVSGAGLVSIEHLKPIIAPLVSSTLRKRISSLSGFIPFSTLSDYGLNAEYDSGALALRISLAADETATRNFNINNVALPSPDGANKQANFSAGISTVLRPRFSHTGDKGFQPLQGEFRSFANVGGFDGITLINQTFFTGGGANKWRVDEAVLVKDYFQNALRLQLGTLRPETASFQTQSQLLGLSFGRNYGAIQPFRTLRSTGRRTFLLERPSRVTFEVNGIPIRTQQLPAGSFNVDNFPLLNGPNNVRIVVEDDFGARELAGFSVFSNTRLLGHGITIFDVSAGLQRDSGGVFNFSDDYRVMGFIDHGLTPNLSVGGYADITEDGYMIGARAARGIGNGVVTSELALVDQNGASGAGAIVGYQAPSWRLFSAEHTTSLQGEYRTNSFSGLSNASQGTLYRADLRHQARLGPYNFVFSGSYRENDSAKSSALGASIGRIFGPVNASLGIQQQFSDTNDGDRLSVLFSLTRRFKGNVTARARGATNPRSGGFEISRFARNTVGSLGGRAGVDFNNGSTLVDVRTNYIGSRFEAELLHRYSDTGGVNSASQVTEGRLGFGVGVADGAFGIGRPFNNGFVVVETHKTARDFDIRVLNRQGDRHFASGGGMIPSIAPLQSSYVSQNFRIDAEDAPAGYNLGGDEFIAFPGVRAGYRLKIGSDANIAVIGTLKTENGAALSLVVGDLVPVENVQAGPVRFFTNKSGRFAGENLAPGKYVIVLQPSGVAIGEVTVKETADFIDNLGVVTVKDVAL